MVLNNAMEESVRKVLISQNWVNGPVTSKWGVSRLGEALITVIGHRLVHVPDFPIWQA